MQNGDSVRVEIVWQQRREGRNDQVSEDQASGLIDSNGDVAAV
jgi:hypothetical protein